MHLLIHIEKEHLDHALLYKRDEKMNHLKEMVKEF
jgi:hypothetical protein